MIALLLVLCCGSAQAVEPGPESPTAGESPPGVMEVRVVPPEERAWDALAELDPFVREGILTFALHRWTLMEGSLQVRVSLGTGRFDLP